MLKKISYERLMILFAAIVQIIGFIISLTIEDFRNSIIPCAEKVIPIVNVSGALICVFLFFFNKYRLLQSVISFVQGIFMTLNGHLFLGTFLYSLGVALLFCNKYLRTKTARKLITVLSIWILSTVSIITSSIYHYLMVLAYSLFLGTMYVHIYQTVKKSVLSLFPISEKSISSVELPKIGTELNLKDYELSKRQILIIKNFMISHSSYKELAELVVTSESTVKKEMTYIQKKLGVKNQVELSMLLSLYKVKF